MEEEVEMVGFVLKTPALETPPEAAATTEAANNGLQIPSLNVILHAGPLPVPRSVLRQLRHTPCFSCPCLLEIPVHPASRVLVS